MTFPWIRDAAQIEHSKKLIWALFSANESRFADVPPPAATITNEPREYPRILVVGTTLGY